MHFYQLDQIKRVRLLKKADGYYVQFRIQVDRTEDIEPIGNTIGLDMGISIFYTDSNAVEAQNPKFYRASEQEVKDLFLAKLKGQTIDQRLDFKRHC